MSDGYCRQVGEEELERIDREWAEVEGPREPAPPMANVGLALELCSGANAERSFTLRGQRFWLKPTSYPIALRLLAWTQRLEQLEAMGELIGEHLVELRECYVELAELGGQLLVEPVEPNPFAEADAIDFKRLIATAVDTGDDVPIHAPQSAEQTLHRYNAAHYLYAYLARFGSIPGMVVLEDGRPCPASWRHFTQACAYLRRAEAESSLALYGATAVAQWGDRRAREQFVQGQLREAGQA